MGLEITDSTFSDASSNAFKRKLQDNLKALELLLARGDFGRQQASSLGFGAELEMYIIDDAGHPVGVNQQILDEANDPQLTLELNRYNLEYNMTPFAINDSPLEKTETEIIQQLENLNRLASKHQGRVIPIGILPTLRPEDFGFKWMTDRKRYHALVRQLIKRRGERFQIDINGEQPIQLEMNDVTLEGANTSFQVHYRVKPENFINTFNAFQLVTPLVMAVSANSPGLFGHRLWHETRIPLFKQSIDTRIKHRYRWHAPARVNFGSGWARQSPLELFQQSVNIYPPLLPICGEEDPVAVVNEGGVPRLEELRLHQSSVWLWNRPVYDDADGGHLRIEMRALPAGPTPIDMMANAAFYIGLAESYRREIERLIPALPFNLAEYNFYRAAQFGLDAKIVWPDSQQSGFEQFDIHGLIERNIPRAREGLQSIQLSEAEINKYVGVIEERVKRRTNGAVWQRQRVLEYVKQHDNKTAQHKMLEDYIAQSQTNKPVSEWQ